MKKRVSSDKCFEFYDSQSDTNKAWRDEIKEVIADKSSPIYCKDGLFFGFSGKEKPLVCIAKGDSMTPNFARSVMAALVPIFAVKSCHMAEWDGEHYGGESFSDEELETIADFLMNDLVAIYANSVIDPEQIFPRDKSMQRRWLHAVTSALKKNRAEIAEMAEELFGHKDDDGDDDDEEFESVSERFKDFFDGIN